MRILSLVTNDTANFYRQQVAGLRNRDHTVNVLPVPGDIGSDGERTGQRPISAYLRFYPRAVMAASGEYDVVHANYGLTGPPAIVQPFHPVVLTFWGSDVTGAISPLSRACSRFAEAVVVMSPEMAEIIGGDCHVIPHGVDFETFRPLPQSTARVEVGWDSGAHQVLFPYASSREGKGFPRAEHIVELARPRLDDPVELLTMSGVPHDRVPWYMNAADAMLLPSKREGSPNTVKEALACNLPVVTTDVGDIAQRVEGVTHSTASNDDEALVDALVAALQSEERSNGREVVSDLRLTNQLDRIEAIYRQVV